MFCVWFDSKMLVYTHIKFFLAKLGKKYIMQSILKYSYIKKKEKSGETPPVFPNTLQSTVGVGSIDITIKKSLDSNFTKMGSRKWEISLIYMHMKSL